MARENPIDLTLSPSASAKEKRFPLSLDSKRRADGSVSIGNVRKRRRRNISKTVHSRERNKEEAPTHIAHNFHFHARDLDSAQNCSATSTKLPGACPGHQEFPMAKEAKSSMQVTVNEGMQGSGSRPKSFDLNFPPPTEEYNWKSELDL